MERAVLAAGSIEAENSRLTFVEGIKSGIPIAAGYIPIGIAFGLLAKSAGVPNHITILMSLAVYAGASQFIGANLMAAGTAPWEIVMTTFIINLRHMLMSASISRRIEEGTHKLWMPVLAFGITDETFSVASFRKEAELSPKFILGLNILAYASWNVGTWIGIFMARGLPEMLKTSMGIALYAMFIGLLVPSLRRSRPVLVISIMAVAVHSVLHWVPLFAGLSAGWGIIITTLAAAAAGAAIFPGGEAE